MIEGVTVDVYGSAMKLRDVAAITTPDAELFKFKPGTKALLLLSKKLLSMQNLE